MFSKYLFFILSFIAIYAALKVLISKKPMHSVLYLTLAFFAIGGHYILLNAQFLAVVHIIVYAGAIMVLFIYTVQNHRINEQNHNGSGIDNDMNHRQKLGIQQNIVTTDSKKCQRKVQYAVHRFF